MHLTFSRVVEVMKLADRVRSRLVVMQGEATHDGVSAALRDEGLVLGDGAILSLVTELQREFVGAGLLDPLLHQPGVTDILVNGPDQIWIDRGQGLEHIPLTFTNDDEVRALAQRLASAVGRRLDDAHPYVDARMASGVRLHAVLAPIATDGTVISLRIPAKHGLSIEDLVELGSLDAGAAFWVRAVIDSKLSFFISGGTGSGKTTVLAAMLGLVAHHERIVIVEDSAELQPDHPHVVRLQSRLANLEGAGAVPMRDLVRQTLRMRPDRIVVGEVRGAEVIDLLTALNTGHEGGCATVHANSAADVPARIEALGLAAGLDRAAVHALLGAGLDAVVHLDRDAQGRRQLQGIHVVQINEQHQVELIPAVVREGREFIEQQGIRKLRMQTVKAPIRDLRATS
jgi:pilus assembly protein CpaF